MRMSSWMNPVGLVASLAMAPLYVGAQAVNPEKLPKVACSQLTFSADFLEKYPKAPAACLEARVYEGTRYAKFSGKAYLVDPDFITVQVFNVAGDLLTAFTFKPAPEATLFVNGKREKYSQLKVGDPVTFWVSEKRFSIYSEPGAADSAEGLPPR